jgi:hypothetical protein
MVMKVLLGHHQLGVVNGVIHQPLGHKSQRVAGDRIEHR